MIGMIGLERETNFFPDAGASAIYLCHLSVLSKIIPTRLKDEAFPTTRQFMILGCGFLDFFYVRIQCTPIRKTVDVLFQIRRHRYARIVESGFWLFSWKLDWGVGSTAVSITVYRVLCRWKRSLMWRGDRVGASTDPCGTRMNVHL